MNQKGKKKQKGHHGGNPENKNYVAAFKGFNTAIVDFDYIVFDDGAILMIVAEEVSQIISLLFLYRGQL